MDCGKVSASGCNMDFPTMERTTHYLTGEHVLVPIIPIKSGLEGLDFKLLNTVCYYNLKYTKMHYNLQIIKQHSLVL